jgi:polysaccharide biosynthesis/export protein
MSTAITLARHFCYALISTALISSSRAQDAAPTPTPTPAPVVAAAPDPTKSVNFRAAGTSLNAESAAVETTTTTTTAAAGDVTAASLSERRDALEAEIRISRARMEANRRRADVLQSLGKAEDADRLKAEARDLEARVKNAQEQLAQVEEELSRAQTVVETTIQSGEEVILPGNNIELWVNEDTSFNGRYQVRRGGYVILPQIGRVQVAGKTVGQAEAAVRKALLATQLRRATVMIERFEGVTDEAGPLIYLSGEFKNPRPYRIPPGTAPTVVSVILSAGGVSEHADLTHVKVMRMAANRSVVEEVNVKRILEGASGGLGNDVTLTEGDVVVVPSGSMNLVYVTGRVKKPGSYRIGDNEKLTVYGAILQSGGFDNFASTGNVHVLRAMPDGTKAKLPVSIKDVQKGRRPDVILQPNDIVVVPEKWFSW